MMDRKEVFNEYAALVRNEQSLERLNNLDNEIVIRRKRQLKQKRREILREAIRLAIPFIELEKRRYEILAL